MYDIFRFSLFVAVMSLAGCMGIGGSEPPSPSALSGQTTIGADSPLGTIPSGTTWVAYEIKQEGLQIVPSFCAAADDQFYTKPIQANIDALCVLTNSLRDGSKRAVPRDALRGFNPPGATGKISSGRQIKITSSGVPQRTFQLFEVLPGRYFPAYYGLVGRFVEYEGLVPYWEVKQGQINYIGSYNVPIGADVRWMPEAFREAFREAFQAQDPGFDDQSINLDEPRLAKIICSQPSVLSLARKKCFLDVLEASFFKAKSS